MNALSQRLRAPSMAAARALFARVALVLLTALMLVPAPARAATFLRDAEIEYALRQLAGPIATAAGLNASQLNIIIIKDSTLNAFVADGSTIFLHSGLILKLDSATELQAVLAHEMAHIANGHIARRYQNYKASGKYALFGSLLAGALAAGGNTDAAVGVAAGSQSSAQRVFFSHTRAEESAADQSGARFMARAGVSPQGMVDVLDIFRGQEALRGGRQDPYVRTHPLSAERLRRVKGYAVAYPVKGGPDETTEYWFARARGKLGAFLQNPSFTLRKVGTKDQSDVALIRRAVAYHKRPDTKKALAEIGKLVAKRPNDPYAHELRGQILLESRQFGAAVNAYGRAVQLAPKNGLILSGYGRALLALKTRDGDRRALEVLQKSRARDSLSPSMLRDLAVAYARAGQNGQASLATAERYALTGRLKDAAVHAKRASDLLPNGSTGWRRAQDILASAKAASNRR